MEVQRVYEHLYNKSLHASKEWLEGCIGYFKDENSHYTFTTLVNFVEEQWKLADLRDVSGGCLPQALASKLKVTLPGQYSLQIESVINIGHSAYGQLQKMQQVNTTNLEVTEEKQQKWEPKESRMLKLHLCDGVQEIEAIEYSPINFLNLNIVPGTKIILIGPVDCRRGIILLKQQNIKVIGGEVDTLLLSNAPEIVLARKLNIPENAPQLTNVDNPNHINRDTMEGQQEDWPGADDDFDLADVEHLEQLETAQANQVTRNAEPENTARNPHEQFGNASLSRSENYTHFSNKSSSVVIQKSWNSNSDIKKLPKKRTLQLGVNKANEWPDEDDQDLDIMWSEQDNNIESSEDRNLHSHLAKTEGKQNNVCSTKNENDWLEPDDDFDFAQIDQLEQELKVNKPLPTSMCKSQTSSTISGFSASKLVSSTATVKTAVKPQEKIQTKLFGYIRKETPNSVPSDKDKSSPPPAGVSYGKPFVDNTKLLVSSTTAKSCPSLPAGKSFVVNSAPPKLRASFSNNIQKQELDWEDDFDEITLPKDFETLVEDVQKDKDSNFSKFPECPATYKRPVAPLNGPSNRSYTKTKHPNDDEPFVSKRTFHQGDTVWPPLKAESSTNNLSCKLPSVSNTAKTLGNDRNTNIPTLLCSPEDECVVEGKEENTGSLCMSPLKASSSLRNLKQVLKSSARASGTHTVKVFIETLITHLTVSLPEGWHLKARISDGSDTLDVKFSSDVLEKMIGFSAFEFREFKRTMSGNPLVKERVVKALENTQEKLKNLKCPVEIKYGAPLEIPCVVNVFNNALENDL